MLRIIRFILFPLSLIYGFITAIRNFCFEIGLIKSYTSSIKTIIIGNLNVGGTGKTPFTELLLKMLSSDLKIAVVSRGYGRNTKGFFYVHIDSNPHDVGDEPLQIKTKFPGVVVAVCERRKDALLKIEKEYPETQLVILDDAFQHRYVNGHLKILLTTFSQPFYHDFLLPTGNLREARSGSKRADWVVITKCPPDISVEQKSLIARKIALNPSQALFFAGNGYGSMKNLKGEPMANLKYQTALVLSGIASSSDFENEVKNRFSGVHPYRFDDHIDYTIETIDDIKNRFNALSKQGPVCIVTTEKDAVKLKQYESELTEIPLFVLPYAHVLESDKDFNQALKKRGIGA